MACSKDDDVLFEIYRGDDTALKLEIVEEETDVPISMEGWTIFSTIKESYMDEDEVASLTTDLKVLPGMQESIGVIYIPYTASQTDALLPGKYFFDIQVNREGVITTVITGRVRVRADVTRRPR